MDSVSFVIADATATIIKAPLVTPFRIATGQHDELANVFLRLRTGDGICGYGEAAVATHITGETVAATLANLQGAAAALKGRRIDNAEEVCREFAPAFAGNHAGLAALEMALLDISSRERGIPFHRLFPPTGADGQRMNFVTDITVVIGSLEEARAAVRQFAARGFTTFKIKIGRDEELDLSRILAVREIAPDSQLILDANMGFSADRMLAFLDRLDRCGARPVLLEQPVPKHDWHGLATITAALDGSGTLVCADESVGSLADARRSIDTGAVSAINIKSMKSGILEGAEIARLATAHGIPLMLGAMMESALSITASAHFAAGMGCFDFIDLDTTFFITGELAHSPYLDDSGRFDLQCAGPGIGLEPLFSVITHPLLIVIVLATIEALVLWLSRHKRTKRCFDLLPAVFWIYFLPMLAATFGLITAQSPVYGMITTWLLPASLVLLLLPVDMRAILQLGPTALAMFFIGAAGVIAGAVISFALFKPLIGPEFWSGFGAISASWTGGSANMIAVKEALSVQDAVFAPMVIVDTVVPYLWMGIMIAMVGLQPAFDRWVRADRAILDHLGERAVEHLATRVGRRTPAGIVIALMVAFAGSGTAHLIARQLPQIRDMVTSYTWTIMIVSIIGILLSFSPVRRLERSGATRTGYDLLYFVLTAIGAKASVASIGSALVLIAAGLLVVAIHAVILLAGARLLRAPMFLVAAASQANIGGVASAPVVAEVYHPGLASVGLLLAILGNIVGTWLGIACAHLCRMM